MTTQAQRLDLCLCATLSFFFFFFMWPGHKNQSADYKLCRSMCSRVREAQCFLFGSGSG